MDEEVGTVLIPYVEGVINTSVWCVDPGLQMFTNISEEQAALFAEGRLETTGHIYFFAELAVPDDGEQIIHRDSETGKFVSEEYTEEHPATTTTEER